MSYTGKHRRKNITIARCTCGLIGNEPENISPQQHSIGCPVRAESDRRLRIGEGGTREPTQH